jgi:hypothetical protein
MTNTIQQLEDLKEWAQDSTRYERRLNFRGGQLVQPGPGRVGYKGENQWPKKEGSVYDRVKKIFRKKKKTEPWKSVTRNQWGVFPSLEEQFKKIEEIWSGDTKYKSATDLAEGMGYKRSIADLYFVSPDQISSIFLNCSSRDGNTPH